MTMYEKYGVLEFGCPGPDFGTGDTTEPNSNGPI